MRVDLEFGCVNLILHIWPVVMACITETSKSQCQIMPTPPRPSLRSSLLIWNHPGHDHRSLDEPCLVNVIRRAKANAPMTMILEPSEIKLLRLGMLLGSPRLFQEVIFRGKVLLVVVESESIDCG